MFLSLQEGGMQCTSGSFCLGVLRVQPDGQEVRRGLRGTPARTYGCGKSD